MKNLYKGKDIQFHSDYYYYDIVRKNIRKYRIEANCTQQQLADLVGVSMNYIAHLESKNFQKYFTINLVGRIADALKIDISLLFKVDENELVSND